jgi:hypothetical protein
VLGHATTSEVISGRVPLADKPLVSEIPTVTAY